MDARGDGICCEAQDLIDDVKAYSVNRIFRTINFSFVDRLAEKKYSEKCYILPNYLLSAFELYILALKLIVMLGGIEHLIDSRSGFVLQYPLMAEIVNIIRCWFIE